MFLTPSSVFARLSFDHDKLSRWVCLACALMATLLALQSLRYAHSHGFDRWMPEVIEYENVKVAAALARIAYKLDYSFAAPTRVHEALRQGGLTIEAKYLGPLGLSYPDNLSSVEQLNKALKAAASIPDLGDPRKVVSELKPVEPNDLGGVDFYWLAFRIFGIEIQSFLKLYYLIHFATIGLFVLAYRDRPAAMACLVIAAAGHMYVQYFLVGGFPPGAGFGVATPYNQRFFSVVAIIPALHVGLALLAPDRPSWAGVATLAGQTILLAFVYTVRNSALWGVLWIVYIPLGLAALMVLWRFRRFASDAWMAEIFRRILNWPTLLFALVFAGYVAHFNGRVDPIYHVGDEFMTKHMFWHSVFVGLEMHPGFHDKFRDRILDPATGEPAGGDALPLRALENWLDREYGIPATYLVSPIWGYRYKTTERGIREIYLEMLRENPRFALGIHLIHKPQRLLDHYRLYNRRAFATMPRSGWVLLPLAGLFAVAGFAVAGWRGLREPALLGAHFAVGSAIVALPAIVAFSSYPTMSDKVVIFNGAFVVFAGVAAAAAAAGLRRYLSD